MSVAGTIRSLVNARSLQLQCTRVLHESFLLPVHIYIYMVVRQYGRRRGLGLGL